MCMLLANECECIGKVNIAIYQGLYISHSCVIG